MQSLVFHFLHLSPCRDFLRAGLCSAHLVGVSFRLQNNNIYNNLNEQSRAADPNAAPWRSEHQAGTIAPGNLQPFNQGAVMYDSPPALVPVPVQQELYVAPSPAVVQHQGQLLAEQQVHLQRDQARDEHPHLVE